MSNVLGLSFCCSVEISCVFGAETVGTGRDVELCWSTRGYPRSPERSHKSLDIKSLLCCQCGHHSSLSAKAFSRGQTHGGGVNACSKPGVGAASLSFAGLEGCDRTTPFIRAAGFMFWSEQKRDSHKTNEVL